MAMSIAERRINRAARKIERHFSELEAGRIGRIILDTFFEKMCTGKDSVWLCADKKSMGRIRRMAKRYGVWPFIKIFCPRRGMGKTIEQELVDFVEETKNEQ